MRGKPALRWKRTVAGMTTSAVIAASFALIAASPDAKATVSGTINVFAGGPGEGPGLQVGGISTTVGAGNDTILHGNAARRLVRQLHRSNGNQDSFAGNGAAGLLVATADATSVPVSASDIERVGTDVYVATNNAASIVKVDSTNALTVVVSSVNTDGIAVAPDGTIYWSDANRVRRRLTDGTVQVVAGSTTAGYEEGDGATARFSGLRDIDLHGDTLYVADNGNRRLRAINLASPTFAVATVAGDGSTNFAPSYSGPALGGTLRNVLGIDVLPNGDVLVASGDDGVVRVVHIQPDPANNTMERFAGPAPTRAPTTPTNPLQVNFGRAYDVSIAPDGAVAIGTDLGLMLVEGGLLRRVAGNFTHGRGGDGGPATGPLATLLLPNGIAVDGGGNVYVADSVNDSIRKIDTTGTITRFAGPAETFTSGPAGDGGPATSAWMQPYGAAFDKQGNLYFADHFHKTIRKVTPDGIITTIAGTGTEGISGDGPALTSPLHRPLNVAVDSTGAVYVAEFEQTRVRKVSGGVITTVYDDPGVGSVSLNNSSTAGIAVGPDDSLYVADQTHGQIRRVLPGGGYEVVAGSTPGSGNTLHGENGPATSARILPISVFVDHANNLYFNDQCSIRRADAVSGLITTLSGAGRCGLSGVGGPGRNALHGTPTGITALGTDLLFTDELGHRVYSISDVVPPPLPPEADVLSGKIVFDSNRYGNHDIFVSDPDGANAVRLTSTTNNEQEPAFSPDGSRIAFTRDMGGTNELAIMTSGGQMLDQTTGANAFEPAWSPDGNRVVYSENGELWVYNVAAHSATQVFSSPTLAARYPAWLSNNEVVFNGQDAGSHDIYRVSLTPGSTPVALTTDPGVDGQPSVSADGSKVVFVSDRAGNIDVWMMNADGSNQVRLTTDAGPDVLPTFSPDGRYVLYNKDVFELVRIRVDGSNPVTVVSSGGSQNAAPGWVDNLKFTVLATTAEAQPATVEGAEVLLQPQAPAISSSGPSLALLNILGSGPSLALLNILGSGPSLALLNILGSGPSLALLNILGSGPSLALLNILGSGPSLALLNILGSPGVDTALDQISVLSIPIDGGWEAFFADGRPIQGRTLLDALKTGKPVPFLKVDISDTPLARISLFSYFIGQTPLRNLADAPTHARWCTELEKLDDTFVAAGQSDGDDCGNARFGAPGRTGGGLGATLIELELQGISISLFPELAVLPFNKINLDIDNVAGNAIDTPFEATILNNVDLSASDLGSLTMDELASAGVRDAIVDCAAVDGICAGAETLAFAQDQGAVRPDARLQKLLPAIGDQIALLVLVGLMPPEIRPLQAIDGSSAIFASVDEPAAQDIEYAVQYSPVGVSTVREPTISVALPKGFVPVVGSVNAGIGGTYNEYPLKFDGRTMRIRLEGLDVPAGSQVEIFFLARPGQLLAEGRRASARITGPGVDQSIADRAGVAVTERFEPENNTPDTPATPALVPNTLYLTHVAEPGDVDYFTLPMNAGDRIRILLDQPTPDVVGGNADLDLVVYAPQGATTQPLRAAVEPNDAIVPVFDNPNRLGEPVRPDVLQDIALLPKPVAALSTNRGGFNESVSVLAPVTGNYVIQVSGYNGASSSQPYTLQASLETGDPIPACPSTPRSLPVVPTSQRGSLPTSIGSAETLVLVNQSRLYSLYDDADVDALMSRVQSFAAHASVKGAVIGLDGNRADGTSPVRNAYTAWDADPCSAELANDVVRTINAEVDRLVDLAGGQIKNIVVVGNDEVMPMARIPDLTQAANERSYADAVKIAGGSLSTASAIAAGNVLSDDPYGDARPAPYLGRHLYVSDVGLGRLVESPTDIDGQLANYLATFSDASSTNDGRLAKSTAFTAGYDFMTDLATAVDGELDALTGASASADNQRIGNDWTDLDLEAKFTNAASPASLVSLNAHFSHNSLEPPTLRDPLHPADSRLTTADVDSGSFTNGLVFSMGCHSGLNVPDIVVGAANPATRDWAQALAAKKSTFVGQTGFGYGLKDSIALSEDIMLGFTKNLTTTMTVGQALAYAKHDYLGGIGVYGVYDEKALAQATMYGLPHWKVGTNPIPGSGPSLPTTVDERTGLQAASFDHADTFTQHATADGTHWTGLAGSLVVNDRPLQPKAELDVTQANGLIAHGTELTGLTSDEVSANAVYARVVLDDSSRETEVEDPTAVFPAAMQRINDFSSPSGDRQRLVLMTGQYRATGVDQAGDVTGAQRFYRRMAGKIQYSTSNDFTLPDILFTNAAEVGDAITFDAAVTDPLGANTVKAVSVLYHAVGEGDAGSDVWTRLVLNRDPSDATRWLATGGAAIDGDGSELEYLVVALDEAGNASYATRKGAFYAAASPVPPPAGLTTTVVGQPSASGWYPSAEVQMTSDDPTITFEYSVDGGTWRPYDAPIDVTDDGVHTVAYRTNSGDSGEIIVPIDTAAPTVTITTPANNASYAQGASVAADYGCADEGAGVATCAGSVADGAAIDTSSAGSKTFSVTATDGAGHETTKTVSYTVTSTNTGYTFDGFYAPLKNGALAKAQAGSTVPAKWRLYTASGAQVTNPASVTKIRSIPISCSGTRAPTGAAAENISLSGAVKYDTINRQFVFNWKTNKTWIGTCRRLEITFTGGLVKTADVQFTL